MSSSTAGLVSCVELWFEQVRKSWSTPNSWQIILWTLFPLEHSGSSRFGRVKPPELMSCSTAGLVSSIELWFEQVRKSWTTPNSWEIILWSLFPLELSDSAKFGRGGSTFPLSSKGNKDHRIISHEFAVVQLFRTCLNLSSTQETRPAVELDFSTWQCVTSCAHTHFKLAAHSTAAHSKRRIIAFQNQRMR